MKLYKVVSKDNKSFNGGDFDWTLYLPDGDNPGEWTPHIEDIVNCRKGYHVTPYPCMWYERDCNVYEVETRGEIKVDEIGTLTKLNCQSIRLIKKIEYNIDDKLNSGDYNSGDYNSGNYNSGYRNSGNRNSGYRNSGHCNSGNHNSGNRNSGNHNSGNYNSGYHNSGNYNSGNHNSGNHNSGNHNSGNHNSGNYNSGYRNSGDYNSGDYHTGSFNTGNPQYVELFNKQISKQDYDKIIWPNWIQFEWSDSEYKASWSIAFDKLNHIEDLNLTINLPNFDYVIFEEITGISKKDIDKKIKELQDK